MRKITAFAVALCLLAVLVPEANAARRFVRRHHHVRFAHWHHHHGLVFSSVYVCPYCYPYACYPRYAYWGGPFISIGFGGFSVGHRHHHHHHWHH